MKFYSEQLNKLFDTAEELQAAEEKVNAARRAEEEKKAQLKASREARAKEVEEAIRQAQEDQKKANASNKHAVNVLNAFVKDFGAYHTTFRDAIKDTAFEDIFSAFFGNLF